MPCVDSSRPVLFVAHPGHEVLLHGWLCHTRPVTHVLTDGSGHVGTGRISLTGDLLRSLHAPEGAIFGRFSDREVYAAILGRDDSFFYSIVTELADDLLQRQATVVVADAAEGYNPVHDLCRMVVGAACDLAGRAGAQIPHYEYAVVDGPESLTGAIEVFELDDEAFAAKMRTARALSPALVDVDEMLARFGADAFRRETFRPVEDWTTDRFPAGVAPRYERFGADRVAAGLYAQVIRHREHFSPLREALRDRVASTPCAF